MIITIDGPSGAGKGTVARLLAHHFGYAYLDTGLFFRQVAYVILKHKGSAHEESDVLQAFYHLKEAEGVEETLFRTEDISKTSSIVSTFPSLREKFLEMNRQFARDHHNVVFDGRDMGTIIFPEAEKKIFLHASSEVRAKRRMQDLENRGITGNFADILKNIEERDFRDANRLHAPTKPAPDAFVLDTSHLSIDAVLAECISFVRT